MSRKWHHSIDRVGVSGEAKSFEQEVEQTLVEGWAATDREVFVESLANDFDRGVLWVRLQRGVDFRQVDVVVAVLIEEVEHVRDPSVAHSAHRCDVLFEDAPCGGGIDETRLRALQAQTASPQ